MAQITVSIAGRAFRMACEDGQEEHLESLARRLDERIADMRRSFGEIGDQRLTVMAAISLADDSAEARTRADHLRAEIEQMREAARGATVLAADSERRIAAAIEDAAARIERAADAITAISD